MRHNRNFAVPLCGTLPLRALSPRLPRLVHTGLCSIRWLKIKRLSKNSAFVPRIAVCFLRSKLDIKYLQCGHPSGQPPVTKRSDGGHEAVISRSTPVQVPSDTRPQRVLRKPSAISRISIKTPRHFNHFRATPQKPPPFQLFHFVPRKFFVPPSTTFSVRSLSSVDSVSRLHAILQTCRARPAHTHE